MLAQIVPGVNDSASYVHDGSGLNGYFQGLFPGKAAKSITKEWTACP
jgi:hypothetical protein